MKRLYSLVILLLLTLTGTQAFADQRYNDHGYNHGNNRYGNSPYRTGRHDYRPNYYVNGSFGNVAGNRYRQRQDNWSVSMNVGSRYYNPMNYGINYGFSYSTGFYNGFPSSWRFRDNFYRPWRNTTSIVYTSPTVVYVDRPAPRVATTRVIKTDSSRQPGLLRDIDGNCFERYWDSNGVEHREQLSDNSCDF